MISNYNISAFDCHGPPIPHIDDWNYFMKTDSLNVIFSYRTHTHLYRVWVSYYPGQYIKGKGWNQNEYGPRLHSLGIKIYLHSQVCVHFALYNRGPFCIQYCSIWISKMHQTPARSTEKNLSLGNMWTPQKNTIILWSLYMQVEMRHYIYTSRVSVKSFTLSSIQKH